MYGFRKLQGNKFMARKKGKAEINQSPETLLSEVKNFSVSDANTKLNIS